MIEKNGMKRRGMRRRDELALVVVGAIGLGCVALVACSGDDSTTGGTSSGGSGGSVSTGGTGGSTSTGGSGGSMSTGGASGSTSTGGSAGTSSGGTAGTSTGGSGGTLTGGSGGTSTGGSAGTSTGGSAGTSTGGSGGTLPDGGAADVRRDSPSTDTGTGIDASVPDATGTGDGGVSACSYDPSTASNTAAVVDAANVLLGKLTAAQKTAIQLDSTVANARQWSNLPTTFVPRVGVPLIDMSADAQTAAVALVSVAGGTTGAAFFAELRAADQYLVTNGGASATDYGTGRYFVSFQGVPSATAKWMLQVSGHHFVYNFMYNAKCTSATPFFDGVEPLSWTDSTAHAPLETQRAALVALLAAVSSKTESKLTGTFSDLLMGPVGMGGDTKYPASLPYPTGTTGRGVSVASLTASERALVNTAIEAWVKNIADPIAASLLAQYESKEALDQTYVGYAGSTDLSTQGSYVRIDGPRAWIEFTVQGGIVYKGKVHFHTIWRDKAADYGAEFR